MTRAPFIVIDGKLYRWKDILELRRAQLAAAGAGQASQLALFATLHDDRRDIVIHVSFHTSTRRYSKGVLVQAKRIEPDEELTTRAHADLVDQCNKMIQVTPASFVFDYAKGFMRCGSASRIAGVSRRNLYNECIWTSYRFFLELFRSPIGDPRLTSARVQDLPVPTVVKIKVSGD